MLLTPGRRLGPYTIESLIGSRGMGEVYRARDERLNRTVAIKRLIAGDVNRFQSEARAIAAIDIRRRLGTNPSTEAPTGERLVPELAIPMGHQQHQSDPRILDRRRLSSDHRSLAGHLAPGMAVLDVGCGTGSITKGIAEAVGPGGVVVGVDRDQGMVDRACVHGAAFANLSFARADATELTYDACFDVVTAARTLQWIADPLAAVQRMMRAAKPGGLLIVLDYNHTLNSWDPIPPPEFSAFYSVFLSWRESNGWDNEVANRCSALFKEAGLSDVHTIVQDETSVRGDVDFAERTALWTEVIDNLGPRLQSAGVCDTSILEAARRAYEVWRTTDLRRHTLSMKATVGRRPSTSA